MTERDQYQQALTHARAGDLQAARKLLLKLNTPEAEKLLARVNARILALQDADEPPAPAAKAKPAPKAKSAAKEKAKPTPLQYLLATIFVCGGCWLFMQFSANPPEYGDSPEDNVREAVVASFGRISADGIETLVVNDEVVTVSFPIDSYNEESTISNAELNFPQLICALRERGLTGRRYIFQGIVQTIDSLGNEGSAKGIEAIFAPDVIAAVNCESARNFAVDTRAIAESFTVFPVLQPR
jgi:hypothetical protein